MSPATVSRKLLIVTRADDVTQTRVSYVWITRGKGPLTNRDAGVSLGHKTNIPNE